MHIRATAREEWLKYGRVEHGALSFIHSKSDAERIGMQNSIYSRVQTAGGLSDFTLSTLGGLVLRLLNKQSSHERTSQPARLSYSPTLIYKTIPAIIYSLSCVLDTMHWLGCCRRWIKENHRQKWEWTKKKIKNKKMRRETVSFLRVMIRRPRLFASPPSNAHYTPYLIYSIASAI